MFLFGFALALGGVSFAVGVSAAQWDNPAWVVVVSAIGVGIAISLAFTAGGEDERRRRRTSQGRERIRR